MTLIHLCDYGIGNTFNVKRALEHVGATVKLCTSGRELDGASAVVIPGVGAFSDCIRAFRQAGFEQAIKNLNDTGVWILGICVGMQMLATNSEEFGCHDGMDLIGGSVQKIYFGEEFQEKEKLPHVGWARLSQARSDWSGSILTSSKLGDPVYFVHSYQIKPLNDREVLAVVSYHGIEITAAVQRNRLIGVQFHPEKSGAVGLNVLSEFVKQASGSK